MGGWSAAVYWGYGNLRVLLTCLLGEGLGFSMWCESFPLSSPGVGSSIPTPPQFLCLQLHLPLSSHSVAPFPPDAFDHHHVAQLLRRFSSDYATSQNISLDAALAHHLQQCSYHLRLFRSWLISGQDDLECLHGTARRSCLGPMLL